MMATPKPHNGVGRGNMKYEVELKFRLEQFHSVEAVLQRLGATEKSVVSHVDRYFNHPSRDFRSTDEAFRIRSVGEDNCVTYKGAVIGTVAKTRHEVEVAFASGIEAVQRLDEIVRLLGFRPVREVRKNRRNFTLNWNDRVYELALDDVPGLGRFLEIELIAENDDRKQAEEDVWKLARTLGLSTAEPRSYLDMLVELDDEPR